MLLRGSFVVSLGYLWFQLIGTLGTLRQLEEDWESGIMATQHVGNYHLYEVQCRESWLC